MPRAASEVCVDFFFISLEFMRSEKYLTTLLGIMYAISESEDRYLHQQDYSRMSGIYRNRIEEELFNNEVIYTRHPRPLRSNSDFKLLSYIDDIENELKELRQKDEDRKLDNNYKKKGIRFGGWGLVISIISILLSIFNLLQELHFL